jgi:hypothetical protein
MIVDFALLVVVSILSVGLVVVGGFVSTDKGWTRACFLIGGPILVLCIIGQGIRQILAQIASDDTYMSIVKENERERQRSDTKIDGLFALLQANTKETPTTSDANPKLPSPSLLPPNNGTLTITQSSKVSTRPDAPYETDVVVQTSTTMPTLKMAIQCDKELVSGALNMNVVDIMESSGVLKDHPNIFIYSYSSSMLPFGPSNPVIVDLWSKKPITCNRVASY